MKKVILLLAIVIISTIFLSCDKQDNIVSYPSDDTYKSSYAQSDYETFLFELMQTEHWPENLGKAYQIDKEFMAEMNENKDASPRKKLDIIYKYADKWSERMDYYYISYSEALDEAKDDDPFDGVIKNDYVVAKMALETSQHKWQQSLDSDREWMRNIFLMERASVDFFSSYYYNAYRKRTIDLYYMCSGSSFLNNELIHLE